MGPLRSTEIASGKQALEQAYDTLGRSAQTCREHFGRIVEQVGEHRAELTPVLPVVRDRLAEVRGHLQQGLDTAQQVLDGGAEVLMLFTTGIDYLTLVQAPLADLAYDAGPAQDDDLDRWGGPASAAYHRAEAAQRAAAEAAADQAEVLSRWLYDVGRTNVAYAARVVRILVEVAARLVEVSGTVPSPAALTRLAATVGAVVTDGERHLAELARRYDDTLGAARAALDRAHDQREFPQGRWPRVLPG